MTGDTGAADFRKSPMKMIYRKLPKTQRGYRHLSTTVGCFDHGFTTSGTHHMFGFRRLRLPAAEQGYRVGVLMGANTNWSFATATREIGPKSFRLDSAGRIVGDFTEGQGKEKEKKKGKGGPR